MPSTDNLFSATPCREAWIESNTPPSSALSTVTFSLLSPAETDTMCGLTGSVDVKQNEIDIYCQSFDDFFF